MRDGDQTRIQIPGTEPYQTHPSLIQGVNNPGLVSYWSICVTLYEIVPSLVEKSA